MKLLLIGFIILTFSLIVLGQNSPSKNKSKEVAKEKIIELSSGNRSSKPKLSMQEALKVMDKYIKKEKINTSKYFLWQVKSILYGGESENTPAWHFWWLSENGGVGDYR